MSEYTLSASVPITSERSSSLPSQSVFRGSSNEVHKYFVFDTARSVRCELYVLIRAEGIYGFDKANRAHRYKVVAVYARTFELFGDVYDEAQVVLHQRRLCLFVAAFKAGNFVALLLLRKRQGKRLAAADVVERIALEEEGKQPF